MFKNYKRRQPDTCEWTKGLLQQQQQQETVAKAIKDDVTRYGTKPTQPVTERKITRHDTHSTNIHTDWFSVALPLLLCQQFGVFCHHLLTPQLKEVSWIRVELQAVLAVLARTTTPYIPPLQSTVSLLD